MNSKDYEASIAAEKARRHQQLLDDIRARRRRENPPETDGDGNGGSPVREPRNPTPGASPSSLELAAAAV